MNSDFHGYLKGVKSGFHGYILCDSLTVLKKTEKLIQPLLGLLARTKLSAGASIMNVS